MSFHFVNVATPNLGISPEVRAHVMRDFMRRKVSRTDQNDKLYRQAKRNEIGSLKGKLRKRLASNDFLELPDILPSDYTRVSLPQETCVAETDALVPDPGRCLVAFDATSASGPPTILRTIDSSHRNVYTDVASNFSTESQRLEERNGKRCNERLIVHLLEMMRPFSTISGPKCIGSQIDPFHSLPQLPNTQINIENLKKHCEYCISSVQAANLPVRD